MVYALEWFDIPRNWYTDMVEYHPYLTNADLDKLQYIKMQNYIENGISFSLFFLIANRLFYDRGSSKFSRRLLRWPAAGLVAGAFA